MIPHLADSRRPAAARLLPEAARQAPVVGWRAWSARPTAAGAVLEGVHSGTPWDPGGTRAECRRCPPWMANLHPVPLPACECGLYAFTSLDEALRHLVAHARMLRGCGQPPPVAGAVIGWGRVVQHGRQGWRAERARPVALLATGHPLLEALARRYSVPIVPMRGLRFLPLEYGEALTA